MSNYTMKIPVDVDLIKCEDCGLEFVLYAVLRKDPHNPYMQDSAVMQGQVRYCPFCGERGNSAI